MNKLAIIGASYLQLPLIRKAKSLGFETHVFAWAVNDVGEAEADFFYPISIVEKDQILEKCKEIGICGICSIASDLASITVNYVADKMGLVGNSMDATMKSTNKHLMRLAFEKCGDPSPKSILVDEGIDFSKLNVDYPVIVKPLDRSGSRGITKLQSEEGLPEAVKYAMQEGFQRQALIEEFAEGREYSVECISYRGEHYFLAMTTKFTTGAPHFVETGHIEPADVTGEILDKVKKVVYHALDSLGIENGASHSELKIDDSGNIKLIEIGGRMGGDCIGSHLVYYSTGIDFVKAVIDVACGKEPDLMQCIVPQKVGVQFIIEKDDLQKLEKVRQENRLIELVNYQPEKIGKMTDSSNRAGCFVYRMC